jgi:kynureninase
VFDFHVRQSLTIDRLRAVSVGQVGLLEREFERIDVDPTLARVEPISPEGRGGFLAIRTPRAHEWVPALKVRGVSCDARGEVLRLGPAPYLRDDQLRDAMVALREIARSART